jgi:hypothetical protein
MCRQAELSRDELIDVQDHLLMMFLLEARLSPTLCLWDHAPFTLAKPAREITRTPIQYSD